MDQQPHLNNNPYPPYSPADGARRPLPPHSRRSASIDTIANTAQGARMQIERQNGAMPMPVGNNQRFPMMEGNGNGLPQRMAVSPPKNKNTQHVPCKFFLQGQCQAGAMCPFSHDIESTTRPAPCKYFAKGGCKFGRKCALLHITQDGHVVNPRMPYPPPQRYMQGPPQPPPPSAYGQPPPGLLSMQAQGLEQRPNGGDMTPQDFEHYQYAPRSGYDTPQIDMTYTSASPKYGSPPQQDRIATSPPQKGLSVLDAPLPNSFDSNGISFAARNGPFAASVPSKWNLDSPPSSLPRNSQLGSTALRDLRTSAFGDRGMDSLIASMGSSPPSGTDEPISFEKRPLHSDRLRASRNFMSASLGTRPPMMGNFIESSDDDDGADSEREEDLLPSSLHDLIPDIKARKESRSSRNHEDGSPASFLAASRRSISGHTSPHLSGSPGSRFSGMFSQNAARDGLGHVGSPLRDSSFPTSHSAGFSSNGELSPGLSSPPRQASMSMLTQELQRTKLDAARGKGAPAPTRTLSNGSAGRTSMDRALSSNSVSQRIEEEQEVFSMDFDSTPKRNDINFGAIGGGRTAK
ncbi:hypothetical protein CLAFUW4_09689 [Fulvia fulva]|uniref:C3H1-type domain-containing protein n=1 Tax=Passalora fulva TaxID=5499 RepID=A0A9Q8PGR5_PASFU|nr:uncharacterized protein CLAFUR5_09783 [Fulvia fulva]KAK4614071.1 hypothetical protein CLAFUR4_09694 [Fulvia fulva]KAK4614748.1 hypothetical protein CLAFUR0_09685 [Fulvia fulva]UJO22141.1 hypothetical protein CLAFUR5_09783 [Fulvia fulva]WPV20452.1 hypothetical protein CLAFUW4_09689 [Fulvia fulva]WPV35620.1 hypothetical protein CLAFUW7_09690 [Fulvia fulva]